MSNPIESSGHFLPYLTNPQVAELDKDNSLIVLPLASIEQHGPHLPVFTDSLINLEVLSQALDLLEEDFPVWVLPILPYGKSNEHAGFPGTFTLTSETLIRVLKEVAENVARNGFRRFVILNFHGGNAEIVDFVIRDIREHTGLLVFGVQPFFRFASPEEGLSEDELTYGIHAGDVETSILLHSHPELVKVDLAPDGTPAHLKKLKTPPFLGPLNFAWVTKDISPTGVLGNAQTADPARGQKYLQAAAEGLADLFRQALDFNFEEDTKSG